MYEQIQTDLFELLLYNTHYKYRSWGIKISRIILILLCGLTSVCSQAQEAGAIDLGGFELTPTANVALYYDDNITRSAESEISTWVNVITPQFLLDNEFRGNSLQFGYRLSDATYFSSRQDNYTDNFLFTSFDYDINSRHRAYFRYVFEDGHDDRGTRFTTGVGSEFAVPDQYKQNTARGVYSYGAQSALARLDFRVSYLDLNYDINTEEFRVRDRATTSFGSSLYLNISPATDLTLDLVYNTINYDFTAQLDRLLDSDEVSVLVGAVWENSSKITGSAKVGIIKKDFENPLFATFDGLTWEAGLSWKPAARDTFELNTNGGTREINNGAGNFIRGKDVSIQWNHNWLDRLGSSFQIGYAQSDYANSLREDKVFSFRSGLNYDFRRWLKFNVSYTLFDRDSTSDIFAFQRNVFNMTARFTL